MTNDKIIALRKLTQQYAYISIQMHESIARQAGFSGTDHKYLGFFLQKGALTAGELADLTGLTTGAVTGLIDRFEKKNLVKREFDKSDRRKVIIVPDSEKIMALFEPFYKDFQAETENLIAAFSNEEIEIIETYFSNAVALMTETNNRVKQMKSNEKSIEMTNDIFYHGTKADLKVGDLLTAGFRSNYKPEVIMNHIYFTALANGAGLAAALAKGDGRERVYIVEPMGSFEDDPNVTDKKFPGNPTRSYRSQAPLKIVGELTDWVRLTPDEIQIWQEKIAKLEADSKAEIIN
jgi:DNA-binding MarR family transcriptional regulator